MWHSDSVERCHPASTTPTQDPEDDTGIDVEELSETDKDRRQTMMTSMDESEANELKTGTLSDFWGDFILPKSKSSTRGGYGTGDNSTRDHVSPRGTPPRTGGTSTSTCTMSVPLKTRHDPEPRPGGAAKEEVWRGEHGLLCHTVAKPFNTTDSALSNCRPSLNVTGTGKWSCLVCTL